MIEILERLTWHTHNTVNGSQSIFADAANEIARLTAERDDAQRERDEAREIADAAFMYVESRDNEQIDTGDLYDSLRDLLEHYTPGPNVMRITETFPEARALGQRTAQPAAPTPDAETDIAQLLVWASNSHEHASGHAAMVEDDRARCAIEAHGLAIRHLIDTVSKLQKGEK